MSDEQTDERLRQLRDWFNGHQADDCTDYANPIVAEQDFHAAADALDELLEARKALADRDARIRVLERQLAERTAALEELLRWILPPDGPTDKIDKIKETLKSDEQTARIRELEQQLADRDAAWERAIQSLAQQGVMMVDDAIAAVRFWMEAEGDGA